ncbi:uncharacterized protein LOC144108285 [Amblyomma americanum]
MIVHKPALRVNWLILFGNHHAWTRLTPPILTPFPLLAIPLIGTFSSERRPYVNSANDDEALPRIPSHILFSLFEALLQPEKIGQHREYAQLTTSKEIASRQATSDLRKHLNAHAGKRPFKCPHCSKSFTLKSNMVRHYRIHTGEKPFQCPYCSKSFSEKRSVMKHIHTHTGEKPFYKVATVAGGRITGRERLLPWEQQCWSLKLHWLQRLPLQGSDTSFICYDIVPGLVSTRSARSSPPPKKLQAGRRQYVCPECGYSTYYLGNFRNHLHTHTGDRPFQCKICSKSFCGKSHLRVHFDIHVGERPFKCPCCSKSFTKKSNMVAHYRIHTGEKPFQCPHCSKRFTQKISLVKHIHTHTVKKPF